MGPSPVIVEKKGRTAWIFLNRPEAMNSLTREMCAALTDAMAQCESDEDMRVVVLSGMGRAFCAGGDLRTIEKLADYDAARAYVHLAGGVNSAIVNSAKPYVAMVNGAAAGAGFNIAMSCDFVYASPKAKFAQAFSSIGLVSDCCGNFLLPRLVGVRAAKELMLRPKVLSAEEAFALGIVNRVADEAELRAEVEALADELAQSAPLAMRYCKKLLLGAFEPFERVMDAEEDIQAKLITSADCKEGVKAFFEKRKPKWRGKC